jgi:hypothetical protein
MINPRFDRQSFLGRRSEQTVELARIAVVGLGGGGSHVAQQLAHIGFQNYILYDNDCVEEHNLNRLIGGTAADAAVKVPKVFVASRLILGLQSSAKIEVLQRRWQENPEPLRSCDLIFGCVDSYGERRELETCARRYLIPYIDVGIDVHQAGDEPPRISGQVILSMPGDLCLTCLGFLTEEKLAQEAARYGAAGARPQVVWANGIVASAAVGIAVDLLTDWTRSLRAPVYLSYDGNTGVIQPHIRLKYADRAEGCPHFPAIQVGEPRLSKV